jgi:hypothetical protein
MRAHRLDMNDLADDRELFDVPARAAGVSSIGLTTLTTPPSIITSRPRPPNSSPFMLLWKSCRALGSK